ncbi:MAG: hypothetical protein MUC56_17335 [Thermoanaerobaculales bacterium]|jgi:hypothetical protein|nr:hypothetical protein [Thermoanaerobaculales bacterium]
MGDEGGQSWVSCLGWGCLAVVVIAVVGIGGCVAFVYKGGSDAHATAEAYLAAVDGGRWEEAFATLGPGFTADRGLADFVAFEQAARAELGGCGDWKMSGTSFNREEGRSVALLTFLGSCGGEPATVAFNLEKIDRRWLIQDIRYNEAPSRPVIELCVECGGVLPPGSRFCPSCGAPVEPAGAPDEVPSPMVEDAG